MKLLPSILPAYKRFAIKACRDISFEFQKDGYEVIHRYSKHSFHITPGHKTPKTICLDDLGAESNIKHFGSECNVMAEVILSRYDLFISARLFMHKVREAMKSSGNNPMSGNVHVDMFVVDGKEEGKVGRSYHRKKKKAACAVELTDDGKVKRMYSIKIDNYSSRELKRLFNLHISEEACVTTDCWRGYRPIKKDYNIEQVESMGRINFKALHTMIHQVKSWLRTTCAWVSDSHIDKYFNEFCYRINRSQMKANIFNSLIRRMVDAEKFYHQDLICT